MANQINRREFVARSSSVVAGGMLAGMMGKPSLSGRAKGPYDYILVEGHRDIYEFNDRFAAGEKSPLVESMLPRYLEGGIDVIIMPVGGTHPALRAGNHKMLEGTLQVLDMIIREIGKTGGQAGIIKSKADIPTQPDEKKVLFFLDMEGAEPIQINPESRFVRDRRMALVRSFYRMGVRGIQLTHNERNYLADGIQMDGRGAGKLTPFGIEVVEEMNRLGMMVGVSHLSKTGIMHAAEISTAPLVSTHTNIRAFIDTPRQHSDEEIRAIASTGGIVGIRYILNDTRRTSYKLLVDEIEYIANMVGVEHTGVGWYGHDKGDPRGGAGESHTEIETMSMYEQRNRFIQLLNERGFTEEEISLIVGGNYLRIWDNILS